MGKCSFGKVTVNDIFEAKFPFGKDLEGRFIYLKDGSREWLLAVFDFAYTFRRTCNKWRESVSEATGIPVSNIWYHDLQIHSAPIALELDGEPFERLYDKCIPVIKSMMSSAEEAEISYSIIDLEGQFNMNREQYIPELGAVTVWAGLQFDNEGRPYSQDPDIMLLEGYKPDIPAFRQPIYFDRPADPQGVIIAVKSKTGRILGTLTRLAAHPDVAVIFDSLGAKNQLHYHPDWPGYVRETMDRDLGGIGLCINGPCGNLSARKGFEGMETYEACDEEARRIGEWIAHTLLTEWRKNQPDWEDIKIGKIVNTHIDLPMRDSIPSSLAESEHREEYIQRASEALRDAIANNEPPAIVKRLIDEKWHQTVIRSIVNRWAGMSESELKSRLVGIELEAMSLNGLILAGLPGESLTETCQWLKAQSIGNKLIVFDQINGYTSYMVTTESYDQGGYSYWGSWLRRDAERIMRNNALKLIKNI